MSETTPDAGLIAYENGDYTTALNEWLPLAESDNAQACHNLALLYEAGQGVEQNAELAKLWCEKAAKLGLATAWHHLGYMLLSDDPTSALHSWQQAAEQGLANAQYDLASQYMIGKIVAPNNDTAADWYEAAAFQGHINAQFNLGVLYANVHQYANARYWWQQAADQGHEQASLNLVRLSELGY